MKLVIHGKPVPLQRSRTNRGRHYLPKRSQDFRERVQSEWMLQGRPSLHDKDFSASMRFYGARKDADLDNLVKAILDALNTLAFVDDKQLVCLAGCHKLSTDKDGPRTEVELWAASTSIATKRAL